MKAQADLKQLLGLGIITLNNQQQILQVLHSNIYLMMLKPKPSKLEPRSFKNTLIRSRGEGQASKPTPNISIPHDTISNITKSMELPTQNEAVHRKDTAHGTNSSLQSSPSTHKRLKLKDYIYLNSLEKRNKSKSSNSSFSEHRIKTETTIKETNHELEKLQATNIELHNPNEPKRSPEENYSIMIKQEIIAKIAEEKRRLSDLQAYLEKDFTCKEDKTDTFVFLFGIYNKLTDVHKINKQIGDQVIEYSKEEEPVPSKPPTLITPKIQKQVSYHWEENDKELDSPAKIMNNALKMTFDLTKLFNIA